MSFSALMARMSAWLTAGAVMDAASRHKHGKERECMIQLLAYVLVCMFFLGPSPLPAVRLSIRARRTRRFWPVPPC